MTEIMTKSDRDTLVKIARQRERVAKSEARERAAQLIADFERQLDQRYHYDDNAVWAEATRAVEEAITAAQEKVAEECGRLGIPREFAPSLSFNWYSRGRNAVKSERDEMRRVAVRQIEALEKSARTAIERRSVETQEKIMVGGITSQAARDFLEAMPTADSLMPSLSIDSVSALLIEERT